MAETRIVGFAPNEVDFAISWALAALDDEFIDLQYEDYKDPSAGPDAERARDILREISAYILEPTLTNPLEQTLEATEGNPE